MFNEIDVNRFVMSYTFLEINIYIFTLKFDQTLLKLGKISNHYPKIIKNVQVYTSRCFSIYLDITSGFRDIIAQRKG